jgi:hypothetical protein
VGGGASRLVPLDWAGPHLNATSPGVVDIGPTALRRRGLATSAVRGTASAARVGSAVGLPFAAAAAVASTGLGRRRSGGEGSGGAGRGCRCRRDEDGRSRGGGDRSHGELFEEELRADLDERREGALALQVRAQVSEAVVEAAQEVDGEQPVGDGLTELDQGVGEGLHPPAVVGDGEGALAEGAELGVDEDDAGLPIAHELFLESQPRRTGCGGGGGDNLVELERDGAVEPREDMEVHPEPGSDIGEGGIAQHVVGKGVLAEDEEEEAAPLGEGWRRKVEDDGNEAADVEDAESLSMERSDGVGVGAVATRVPALCVGGWNVVVLDLAVDGCVGDLKTLASRGEGLLVAGDVVSEAATLGGSSGCGVRAGVEDSGCLSRSTMGDVGSLLLDAAILGGM